MIFGVIILKLKKGDLVVRISYGKDILFRIDRIIKLNRNNAYAILKGVTVRVEADAPIYDIVKADEEKVIMAEKTIENHTINNKKQYRNNIIRTGKILHLDGDRRYSEKSMKYYRKMGLNAVVKNVPENRQPMVVVHLLEKYKPDILVITGHDAMLKNGVNYANIYNYRNSKNFIATVKEARKWAKSSNKLVIFAGACQSFFEAIIDAGADFASSPGRILIDFIDPLIVAEKIATTDRTKFISGYDIAKQIKEGEKGISGIGTMGKCHNAVTQM